MKKLTTKQLAVLTGTTGWALTLLGFFVLHTGLILPFGFGFLLLASLQVEEVLKQQLQLQPV